ncbi:hypothetical protein AHAS_Ahas09G0262900 [Arachis hypogaea]
MYCRLRSSLWLQFKPEHIAAGAAYLAAKFLNMDLAADRNIWQEFQTTPSILQEMVSRYKMLLKLVVFSLLQRLHGAVVVGLRLARTGKRRR